MRNKETEMHDAEKQLAKVAKRLSDWFSKERKLPEGHTGAMPIEDAFVASLVERINNYYDDVKRLTAEVAQEKKNQELF